MKYFFLTICLFLTEQILSQDLGFNDLKYIYQNDVEKVDNYLLKRGFTFGKRKKDKSGTDWYSKKSGKVNSVVTKFSDIPNYGFTFYVLTDRMIFDKIKSECKQEGFVLRETDSEGENKIYFIYNKREFMIKFTIKNENNVLTYIVEYRLDFEGMNKKLIK